MAISPNHAVTQQAEASDFMPYFTIGFFFYEVLRKHLSAEQLTLFLRQDAQQLMTNNFAALKDSFDIFEKAFVSKQTYTRRYMASEIFQNRKNFLLQRLEK